jgi:hypothetical protein
MRPAAPLIFLAAVIVAAIFVAVGGALFPRTVTRVVHVADPRPVVSVGAAPAVVRANVSGKPAAVSVTDLPGFRCQLYRSTVATLKSDRPAFVLEACFRGMKS